MKFLKSQKPQVGEVKILKKNISNHSVEFEKGDKVKIIYMGERGYDLMELSSGATISECGWDLFED